MSGIRALAVVVEVDIGPGLPGTRFVGLPNASLRESRDRIRSAIRNAGFRYPDRRVLVNLAPADLRKEGPSFDLAIALGVLAATGQCRPRDPGEFVVLGELGLEGEIRPVRGALVVAREVAREGAREADAGPGPGRERILVVPAENAADVEAVEGLRYLPVASLDEAVRSLADPEMAVRDTAGATTTPGESVRAVGPPRIPPLVGQALGKRAVEIAAAGGHASFLIGPPGAGKTLLARRLAALHPPLDDRAALEVRMIHGLRSTRPLGPVVPVPFRAPHHTVSPAALVGGGHPVLPGEITMAHRGVLFLDELGEFPARLLETLRQPLEDRTVRIARVGRTVEFPAAFLLVAAMNPCPCGHHGATTRRCRCTEGQIRRYRGRVSGPLLDRFDLHVEVPPVDPVEVTRASSGGSPGGEGPDAEGARSWRAVRDARRRQADRFHGGPPDVNAHVAAEDLDRRIPMGREASAWLARGARSLGLSARSVHRVHRVARTIADLEGRASIEPPHVREALQYRFRAGDGLC